MILEEHLSTVVVNPGLYRKTLMVSGGQRVVPFPSIFITGDTRLRTLPTKRS